MYSIIQWNCQGYRSKYSDLRRILFLKHPAVMVLQETMLTDQIVPRPPNGYSIYCDYSNPLPGKGLATLIRNDIPHMKHTLRSPLQATAFRVGLKRQYTICNLYISPTEIISINEVTSLIDQLPPPTIICGDFNSKHQLWDSMCARSDARSQIIENALLSTSTILLNTGVPTHFHVQTGSLSAIDLTMCSANVSTDLHWNRMDETFGSDHYPLCIDETDEEPFVPEMRFMEHRANWGVFEECTWMPDLDELLNDSTVDELLNHYNRHLLESANLSIPQSSTKPRPKRVPWWTRECSEVNRQRKTALRKYQRTLLIADKIAYCRARAIARNVHLNAKKTSWRKYVDSLNVHTPMSKIWRRIRKIRGCYQNICSPYLIKDDIHVVDRLQAANLLADHYEAVSSNNSYNLNFQRKRLGLERTLDFKTNQNLPYNSPITILELKRMLSLSSPSAAGEDTITYNMIKKSHFTCQNFLLKLMNKIFNSGEFPTQWLTSVVLSFPKPGKPSTCVENYRPISLNSCVGKLMEKILNTRLTLFLESNSHLPCHQFGFRKMQSTADALNKFSSDVQKALNSKQHVICVSFDLRKAYDTTWRYGIMRALYDIGLRGKLATYIEKFLSNRKFKTKIGSVKSTTRQLEQGVPQGSVLSCTLFSVAIIGVLKCIPTDFEALLYVDDLLVYCSGSYVPGMERRMQNTINKINAWADSHGFAFSTTKTNCIHFHHKRKFQTPLKLYLNNAIIPNRESIKYLGMIIDYRMNWKEHIKNVKLDCMKRLDILKCLSHTSWGSDRTTLLRLYRSIIRSKLDYGSFIYSTASEATLRILDPVHNAAIRICTGAYRSSPVKSLYADSGEPSLQKRRMQLLLQYYARTLQLQSSAAYSYVEPSNEENYPISVQIQEILHNTNLNISTLPFTFKMIPVWQAKHDLICTNYEYPKKGTCPDSVMRGYFNDHKLRYHENQFHIFTDGSKSEQGVGSAAVSASSKRSIKLMPESSIFTAELCGILCALQIVNKSRYSEYVIYCDSRAAISVVQHYDSTHPLINKITAWLIKIGNKNKSIKFCWCPAHVGIAENEAADREAAAAACGDMQPSNDEIPYRDWYPIIKSRIREVWSLEWREMDNNKLRTIKDSIDVWPSSNLRNRTHSIILTRLRIGHSKVTHQYLMEHGVQPYCLDCLVPLTIKHIIAECPSFIETRSRIYPLTQDMTSEMTMRHMLADERESNFCLENLMSYLRDIGFYNMIV